MRLVVSHLVRSLAVCLAVIIMILPVQTQAALSYVGGVVNSRTGHATTALTFDLSALTGGSDTSASAGDIVIVNLGIGAVADKVMSISTAGYEELNELYSNETSYDTNQAVYWKIMGASPDTTVTTMASGDTAAGIAVSVHVWRNVDIVTPFDVASTSTTGLNTGRPTPPPIQPTTAGTIIIAMGASAASVGVDFTTGTLSNFRTRIQAETQDVMVGMGSFAWSSGMYTPAQFGGGTTGTADSWTGFTVALRPAVAPTVTTQDADGIGATSATFHGNITATGNAYGDVIRRGFAWGTSATMVGDTATTTDVAGAPFSTGAFTDSAQTLICNTTYYYRPYAVNSVGTSTAPISNSFSTGACATPPTVTTNFAHPGATTATLYGTKTGGEDATEHGFAWGTSATMNGDTATTTLGALASNSSFSSGIGGLSAGATYYFRAYAQGAAGWGYGIVRSFVTGNATPSRKMRLFEGYQLKIFNGKIMIFQQ